MTPNYNLLYQDLITEKFPEKAKQRAVQNFLAKTETIALDRINFNGYINPENENDDKMAIAYDTKSVKEILDYQEQHKLSNVQTAKFFKVSRFSLRRWKKLIES